MRMRYTPLLLALLLVAPSAKADTGFSTLLSGAAEIPVNASTGSGSATLSLNTAQTVLSYSVAFSGLVGTSTAAHIHKAPVGTNGGVVLPFTPPTGVTSGTFAGSFAVTAAQVADLLAGLYYINIHSTVYPGGELRGQINMDVTPAQRATWGRIKALYR